MLLFACFLADYLYRFAERLDVGFHATNEEILAHINEAVTRNALENVLVRGGTAAQKFRQIWNGVMGDQLEWELVEELSINNFAGSRKEVGKYVIDHIYTFYYKRLDA